MKTGDGEGRYNQIDELEKQKVNRVNGENDTVRLPPAGNGNIAKGPSSRPRHVRTKTGDGEGRYNQCTANEVRVTKDMNEQTG